MALHPLAEQFASVAGAYERGRPDYAPAVVGALAAELGIGPRAPVPATIAAPPDIAFHTVASTVDLAELNAGA